MRTFDLKPTDETLALLELLEQGQRDIGLGWTKPARTVIEQLRSKKRRLHER